MKRILLALGFAGLFCTLAKSQDVASATLAWRANKTFDVTQGEWTDEITSVISYGSSKLEWKNADGSIRKTFQVIEVQGQWGDVDQAGNVQYEVSSGDQNGTVTFRRKGNNVTVLLVMAHAEMSYSYELNIQNITVL